MRLRFLLPTLIALAGAQQGWAAAGRQLTGPHAPATTPALSPEEAQKKFTVPADFEVRLFAAEPDVINPVAMTWDERGRLWVVELYEYPLGAPAGTKPRDRIKILEDTDGDGRADKVTVFADGLNLATGILLGYGGAFVGQAPDLLFLQDTNGDDVADKRVTLMTGFGLEDRHELLNGFTWGPDGYLYMTHGVFTFSKVKDPAKPNDSGVLMTAAVARYHPRTKKFEVFAEGTSNPWGVDFDRTGNAFVSACVIDHMFHMAPGGIYARQAGTAPHPYAYVDTLPGGGLPSIVDHKHFRAAYAGIQVYQGDQFPKDYLGAIFMGNIHDSAVHQDRLTPNGSSFKASFDQDFLRANDGWFRPVSSQVGPDGALWVMDWYDKYPCYQNANADPEGVDREKGRVWRVVYTGGKAGLPVSSHPANMNLARLANAELVKVLEHPNVWQRRMAQRILSERRDPESKPLIQRLLKEGKTLETRLAALWSLHGAGLLSDVNLENCSADKEPAIRAWAARLTGERGGSEAISRLESLCHDPDPSVRLAVATAARQLVSGSLTIDTKPKSPDADISNILEGLLETSSDGADPLIPHMIWMASEPTIAADPESALDWLRDNAAKRLPLGAELTRKTVRRICDLREPSKLDYVVDFIDSLLATSAPVAAAALDGMLESQKGNALLPAKATAPLIQKLTTSTEAGIAERGRRLGALWGDAAALNNLLAIARNSAASDADRVSAIAGSRGMKSDAARQTMLEVVGAKNSDAVRVEAIRALGELGGDTTGDEVLKLWKDLTPVARRAAAETLASRRRWALPFLAAIEKNSVSRSELPASVVRSLLSSKDDAVKTRAAAVIGKFRDTDASKLSLIAEKRKVVLGGTPDLKAGLEVAKRTCFTCHKLHGEGAEIGPDLTGVGRSTLDALLANVIDPNQIVGKGYENVEIETKDGRSVSGRLVEDTESRVRLLAAGPKEETVAKSNIASLRVSELSVMPEGLEQMPDEDFRNLIWFILNPPEDHRELTPALRKELIGEENAGESRKSASSQATDGESVALWNPQWQVLSPEFEGTPRKLPEYHGRRNVLMTHPVNREKGSALTRSVTVPPTGKTALTFYVAAHDQGDWEMRVSVDERVLHKQTVTHEGESWKRVSVDLTQFAGKTIKLRLENCANDWAWEFGYWSDLEIASTR